LKPHGISVSVACPPEVKTPMIEKESETIPREAKIVKLMAGSLTVDYAAKAILKGIVKKQFLIIPGRKARFLYYFQRITGLRLSHAVSDRIIQFVQWRQRKKDTYRNQKTV
jgi:3-dehydrosphinganine reductase